MKYRVQLKTTVTAWAEVEVPTEGFDDQGAREWAADEAVARQKIVLLAPLSAVGLAHGPIELAHEELDESVRVIGA